MSRRELLQMLPKNGVGVEVGVHKGEFSEEILLVVKPRKLYLVDPWLSFSSPVYKESLYGEDVTQEEMDKRYNYVVDKFDGNNTVKIIRDYSIEASTIFSNESLDYVYIDGDHTFEAVCNDFDAWFPKIKKGGYICGDDYKLGSWWQNGVVDAVHLNLHNKPLVVTYLSRDQYILKKY